MQATVAFIIPTTASGTERRGRALRSLLAQSDPDWVALAVANGMAPNLPLETRFFSLRGPANGATAALINYSLGHLHFADSLNELHTDWVTVLDEHDTVSEHFVARAKDIGDEVDVVVFHTSSANDIVMPHPSVPVLAPGEIGRCVMFRRSFAERHGLLAEPVKDCVAYMLTHAFEDGARVLLHPAVNYFEKDHRPRA